MLLLFVVVVRSYQIGLVCEPLCELGGLIKNISSLETRSSADDQAFLLYIYIGLFNVRVYVYVKVQFNKRNNAEQSELIRP